eukprot:TRINITY_DN1066_c0_g1_i1.p1 TRINITY_DN1066_c0_g1~~TRINITY_DN1066_c0_g1_i1.p1  ORF type:complete len:251 (-),score=62.44 TRINITY_DN1066_c0_g1_i1:223-975(-)
MAGFPSMKMKRKDLEEVNDDFSDFSLSSPARKIRRLDAELPPIMEEEEPGIPLVFEQHVPEISLQNSAQQSIDVMTEAMTSLPLNEERALVLYKPVHTPLLQVQSLPSSNLSFTVNSNLVPGFKSEFFWSGHQNMLMEMEKEAASINKRPTVTDNCLAVVPWAPSQLPFHQGNEVSAAVGIGLSDPMESKEGEAFMEIEEENADIAQGKEQATVFGGKGENEGLHQWQQQHCMTTPLSQNASSNAIMWSW